MPTYKTWELGCKLRNCTILGTNVKEKYLRVTISSVVLQHQRVI